MSNLYFRDYKTNYHFFIDCPMYNELRTSIINTIPLECWDLDTIFYGNNRYATELNTTIQQHKDSLLKQAGFFKPY